MYIKNSDSGWQKCLIRDKKLKNFKEEGVMDLSFCNIISVKRYITLSHSIFISLP